MAPGMKVTDLGKGARTYRVNLTKGDEMMSGLIDFAEKYKIKSAHFTALGALDKGVYGWTDVERGLAQLDAAGSIDERVMQIDGWPGAPEQSHQGHLAARGLHQVRPANHQGDPLVDVVHGDRELVGPVAVTVAHQQVATLLAGMLHQEPVHHVRGGLGPVVETYS